MRESGILMHITSLPGPYGVGTMGKTAYRFVDFLRRAGQSCWQLLPLTPTGFGDSPYQSCSAYAGNPYLIDLQQLVEQGLLLPGEPEKFCWGDDITSVDYGRLYESRLTLLRRAYDRFMDWAALDAFCLKNSDWLPDFALFMALKEAFDGKPWYQWPDALKRREPEAMWQARQQHKQNINFYCFVQYLFDRQWSALRDYAHQNGIRLIGDVPIYVPLDSVEVWSDPELFQLDETLTPTAVAGCPPDAFSENGQLWGNPLYRWDRMRKNGYRWWLRRLSAAGDLYDRVRLDHFRGFEAYWSVPFGEATARSGKWVKGPGMAFFDALKNHLPQLELIAEDLGFLTPDVPALRDAAKLPGMKVLEFAFDTEEPSDYLPHNYNKNTVCYIGTHDNMTLRQWLTEAPAATIDRAKAYMGLNAQEGFAWGVIRTALGSVSKLCVLQMQDLLELDGNARMNFPGTTGGNWTWRALPDSFSDALADRLRTMTCRYGRTQKNPFDKETIE